MQHTVGIPNSQTVGSALSKALAHATAETNRWSKIMRQAEITTE
jgi:hypothetical protein